MSLYKKIAQKGLDYVSDTELLSLLIGDSANSITDLHEIGKKGFFDLKKDYSLTTQQACKIMAAMEIGRRRRSTQAMEKKKVCSSKDVFNLLSPVLADLLHEEFWVLYLNRSNSIISQKKISQGGVTGTVVDTRLIVKEAINLLASGVALIHNHPSGNTQPSDADKKITEKIKKALELVDIATIDHVIIADQKYLSFADEGIL